MRGTQPFGFAHGRESFDCAQDRGPVERADGRFPPATAGLKDGLLALVKGFVVAWRRCPRRSRSPGGSSKVFNQAQRDPGRLLCIFGALIE